MDATNIQLALAACAVLFSALAAAWAGLCLCDTRNIVHTMIHLNKVPAATPVLPIVGSVDHDDSQVDDDRVTLERVPSAACAPKTSDHAGTDLPDDVAYISGPLLDRIDALCGAESRTAIATAALLKGLALAELYGVSILRDNLQEDADDTIVVVRRST